MRNALELRRFGPKYRAIVFGATGGIGRAFASHLAADPACANLQRLSRRADSGPAIDLTDEDSIADAARQLAPGGPYHVMIDATGMLHTDTVFPEKSLAAVLPQNLAESFAVNAIGPLLLLKHFVPLLPSDEPGTFATLSARVSSISDNRLGGWYGYRATKAALNMFVKTAAIEVARKRPRAVIVALHPGTVRTSLSKRYAGTRKMFEAEDATRQMLEAIDKLDPEQSGGLFAYNGAEIPW